MKKKIIFRWVKFLVLIYSLFGIAFYYFQDSLLLHPAEKHKVTEKGSTPSCELLTLPFNKTDTLMLFHYFANTHPSKGMVVYFHGARGDVQSNERFINMFTKRGYEVLAPEYPGFGLNTGMPSEVKYYSIADQAIKFSLSRFPGDSVLVYGRTIGSAPAAYAASRFSCRQLVLESPVYNLSSLLRPFLFMFPLDAILNYQFPTGTFLAEVKIPTLVIHGNQGFGNSKRQIRLLQNVLSSRGRFVSIEASEGSDLTDAPEYKKIIDSLLQ